MKGAKGGAKSLQKKAKKAKLGKQVARMAKVAAVSAIKAGLASGSGSYKRNRSRLGVRGSGAYSMPAVNSLFTSYDGRRTSVSAAKDETERITVCRREYLAPIIAPPATTSFNVNRWQINPGLPTSFAWLSQIACNYDEYTLKQLVYQYKPVISQASLTGAMGSVLLAVDYNPGAPNFASFREMAEYSGVLETRVCDEAIFGVECAFSKGAQGNAEYIRSGAVPAGQDIKTYDLGSLQIATSNVQSFLPGTLLGHVYIEYTVVLGKPKLCVALGKNILFDQYRSTSAPVNTHPFGGSTAPQRSPTSNLGCTIAGQVVTFPPSFTGRVTVDFVCHAASTGVGTVTRTGGVTAAYGIGNGNQHGFMAHGGSMVIFNAIFDVVPAPVGEVNSIIFGMSITGGTESSMTVSQSNPMLVAW